MEPHQASEWDNDLQRLVHYRASLPLPRCTLRKIVFVAALAMLTVGGASGAIPSLPSLWDSTKARVLPHFEEGIERELYQLVADGKIRPAHGGDFQKWREAVRRSNGAVDFHPEFRRTYVILRPFTVPARMTGVRSRQFIVPEGVTLPANFDARNNAYYFLASGTCVGYRPGCGE